MKGYAKAGSANDRRDRLIAENVDVARRIALRVARRVPDWLSEDDLVASAMVGLAEAADRYDEGREEPFVAFAEKRIRGAVLDELRRGDIMPRRLRAKAREVGKMIVSLEQKLGRHPEDDEIAKALNVSVEEYQDDLENLTHVSIVDFGSELESNFESADAQDSPSALAERAQMRERLAAALKRLPERDAQILALYYVEELSYAEIGTVLSVSESRVWQLHSRAVLRLKAELTTEDEE
jgi:RNA polymerase sigma factor FliA